MIDLELIRTKPEWVHEQLRKLNDDDAHKHVDAVVALDAERRQLITRGQQFKEARNVFSKGAGKLRGDKNLGDAVKIAAAAAVSAAVAGGDVDKARAYLDAPHTAPAARETDVQQAFDTLFGTLKAFNTQIDEIDERLREVEAQLETHLLWIPNMPHETTPVGASEAENIPHPPEGEFRQFDFSPKAHWDLGPELDIIDFERGVKIAGSRFYIIKKNGAKLYRAMINFLLDHHAGRGYEEVYLPFMVKEEALYGSAQFPKFTDVVYKDTDAELYMVPTAEVPLTNMYAGEILDENALPLKYAAHTPCFRREKMSAGRDVRGIKRVHQFEKVELYKFTAPETSYDEMEEMVQTVESALRQLKIPFRRLEIVTGDLGFAAAKKFDLEVYAPGCDEWLEVSSVSNTEDFQARRANIRYRPADGSKPRYVHTLNGSGLGMTRTLIAVMETYQQTDGSIKVPDVLIPYMGGVEVIEPQK